MFCDADVLMQGAWGQGKTGVCSLVHSRYPAFSCELMQNTRVYIPTCTCSALGEQGIIPVKASPVQLTDLLHQCHSALRYLPCTATEPVYRALLVRSTANASF